MSEIRSIDETAGKAEALRALHGGPSMLVLPNAWDAASARAVERAGFPAIATTSAGVALAMGYEDHQQAPLEEMLTAAKRVVQAVSVPVTVDFEAGYGMTATDVVRRLVEIGAAGFNFEDTNHGAGGMVDAEKQAEIVAALVEAGQAAGVPLVVNARTDVFIHRQGTPEDQAREGLRRAQLYRQAGADCIYPILLNDEAVIAEFVQAVGTINVNLRPGGALSLRTLARIGVRRVSYAVSIFRDTMAAVERMAAAIKEEADQLSGE